MALFIHLVPLWHFLFMKLAPKRYAFRSSRQNGLPSKRASGDRLTSDFSILQVRFFRNPLAPLRKARPPLNAEIRAVQEATSTVQGAESRRLRVSPLQGKTAYRQNAEIRASQGEARERANKHVTERQRWIAKHIRVFLFKAKRLNLKRRL